MLLVFLHTFVTMVCCLFDRFQGLQ